MPNEQQKVGYHFSAFAAGIAARIDSPFHELIESQAPSALSPIGGYSSGRVEGFRFKEIISFRSAYTQVSGNWSPGSQSWDTVALSVVEGFNVLDTLVADRVVARVASRHTANGLVEVNLEGSRIDGLRIGPYTFNYVLHERFRAAKYRDFVASPNLNQVEVPVLQEGGKDATAICVAIPQFGTVKIGNLLIGPYSRELTMLEFELACTPTGKGTAGNGGTGGTTTPPPTGTP